MPKQTEIERLRNLVKEDLLSVGWQNIDGNLVAPHEITKEAYRAMHRNQREERADQLNSIIEKKGSELLNEFARGDEIVPENFSPKLTLVDSSMPDNDLFRFTTLLWSIPVSQGYGRRMRYLVRDEANGKLVGIFALGDPVFNLKARDNHIGWDQELRRVRLYHVMDAYVLGAAPPYNRLLGGKFIALSAISNTVRDQFIEKYSGNQTIIQGVEKEAELVLVTTTSALGRSSIYNRLKLPEESSPAFFSVGNSGGWGHFHISDNTFKELREWSRKENPKSYADKNKYGKGPSWRLRTIRQALSELGFKNDLLKHGIEREVFLAPLAVNYLDYLNGRDSEPNYIDREYADLTKSFMERWMLPRSKRINDWKSWTRKDTWEVMVKNGNINIPMNFRLI